MTTIRLHGGWHDGLTVTLPAGMDEPALYILPAPTPGLDEHLARDRREIARHLMTRICVYARTLPGIYAYRGLNAYRPDGSWSCILDHAARPCGRCGPCRDIIAANRAGWITTPPVRP